MRGRASVEAVEPVSLAPRAVDAPRLPSGASEIPLFVQGLVPLPAAAPILDPGRRAREFEPLSRDRFGVHFTADAELRELIERARALASHRLPNGDLGGLMKLMAASFVRHEEKRRFKRPTNFQRDLVGTVASNFSIQARVAARDHALHSNATGHAHDPRKINVALQLRTSERRYAAPKWRATRRL